MTNGGTAGVVVAPALKVTYLAGVAAGMADNLPVTITVIATGATLIGKAVFDVVVNGIKAVRQIDADTDHGRLQKCIQECREAEAAWAKDKEGWAREKAGYEVTAREAAERAHAVLIATRRDYEVAVARRETEMTSLLKHTEELRKTIDHQYETISEQARLIGRQAAVLGHIASKKTDDLSIAVSNTAKSIDRIPAPRPPTPDTKELSVAVQLELSPEVTESVKLITSKLDKDCGEAEGGEIPDGSNGGGETPDGSGDEPGA